jgi:hypothetical protein
MRLPYELGAVMVHAEAMVQIDRSARGILEWVLDLDRYKQADQKITKVVDRPVLDASGSGIARYRGRLRGIPTPLDTNVVTLQEWERLVFESAPGVWTRRLVDFIGTFECTSNSGGGTTLRHAETFRFHPALVDRLAGRVLGRWLQEEIEVEVQRLKNLIES